MESSYATVNVSEHALAAALNVPLYQSEWHIPHYRDVDSGRWRLVQCPFHLEQGYTSGIWGVPAMQVLLRRTESEDGWESWMSLTPHEIESQELACRYAQGHSVVMGLGMGWVAINMALNPETHRVTVIEHDLDVIQLFYESGALRGLSEGVCDKIEIVHADAFEWFPEEEFNPVNFLYVDIWRDLDEPQVLAQMQLLQQNVQAKFLYFWGQEIKVSNILGYDQLKKMRDLPRQDLQQVIADRLQLPLLVPSSLNYVDMIQAVMKGREKRGIRAPWQASLFN